MYEELTEENLAEAERIMFDGSVDVSCPECGNYACVEPDADYPCPEPECTGRLVSPLRTWGLM